MKRKVERVIERVFIGNEQLWKVQLDLTFLEAEREKKEVERIWSQGMLHDSS